MRVTLDQIREAATRIAGQVVRTPCELSRTLSELTGAHVVLKGSGTIIQQDGLARVCAFGNPAMATAGMGDVLTGMMASLAAQQIVQAGDLNRAVVAAVCLHALAGDLAADGDDRGLLATDVIEHIRVAARRRPE